MIEVPEFIEVYSTKTLDTFDGVKHFRTICELKNMKTDEILSFGISKVSGVNNYNPVLGKTLAYSHAVRFLFLKLNNGEKYVEDNTLGDTHEQT